MIHAFDGQNFEGLLFLLTVSSQSSHYFRAHSEKSVCISGSEIWKYLGYDHEFIIKQEA